MERLYTIAEAAAALRCSAETVRRAIKRAAIIPLRRGRSLLLTDDDLHALLTDRNTGDAK